MLRDIDEWPRNLQRTTISFNDFKPFRIRTLVIKILHWGTNEPAGQIPARVAPAKCSSFQLFIAGSFNNSPIVLSLWSQHNSQLSVFCPKTALHHQQNRNRRILTFLQMKSYYAPIYHETVNHQVAIFLILYFCWRSMQHFFINW